MKILFRLLLWPILWWGFSPALYCAERPHPESTVQLAPPLPLKLDLSHVTEAAIERTVEHLQQLVHAAEQRADSLAQNLAVEHSAHLEALIETARVQAAVDAANTRASRAEADAAVQCKWKWRWFWAWTGTAALVAGFFIARQYVPFLKLL